MKTPNRRARKRKAKDEFMVRHERAVHELVALYFKTAQIMPREIGQTANNKRLAIYTSQQMARIRTQVKAAQEGEWCNDMQRKIK